MITLQRRQLPVDPLPLGEHAGVVANVPVPKLALFDGRERTSDGSHSLRLVGVGAGLRVRDRLEDDVRLDRYCIGSTRHQRLVGRAEVRAPFVLCRSPPGGEALGRTRARPTDVRQAGLRRRAFPDVIPRSTRHHDGAYETQEQPSPASVRRTVHRVNRPGRWDRHEGLASRPRAKSSLDQGLPVHGRRCRPVTASDVSVRVVLGRRSYGHGSDLLVICVCDTRIDPLVSAKLRKNWRGGTP